MGKLAPSFGPLRGRTRQGKHGIEKGRYSAPHSPPSKKLMRNYRYITGLGVF